MHSRPRFSDLLADDVRVVISREPLLGRRSRAGTVPIPQRVVRQPGRWAAMPVPPLIRMLNVGHGAADIRVRLYLWLWACASYRAFEPEPVHKTTGAWAVLLNLLPLADTSHRARRAGAARQVARAADYLIAEHLASRPRQSELQLLDPSGTGRPYQPWTAQQLRDRNELRSKYAESWGTQTDIRRTTVWEDPPIQVPMTLWTNGSVSALSGAALVVLLVLLDYEEEPGSRIRVPKSRPYEYPVSRDSWVKGTHELKALKFLWPHQGRKVFPVSNANPRVTKDRYQTAWTINHRRLKNPHIDRTY